jgi:hypothetical protein
MKSLKPVVALIASLLVASAALAHSDEYLDTQKSPNGGQTRMASIYHFELVVAKDSKEAKDNPVVVHVTDHAWAKISTAGAVGTATILAGKTKVSGRRASRRWRPWQPRHRRPRRRTDLWTTSIELAQASG